MSTIFYQQRQSGTSETGQVVSCYSLRNTNGITMSVLNYRDTPRTIQVPDIKGEMQEIALNSAYIDFDT